MPGFGRPMLKYDTGRVLDSERCGDVEQIQRSVGSPSEFLGKILRQNRKAEHGRRADRRYNRPL